MNLFEEKPRWPGAPLICLEANLPAFENMDALLDFQLRNGEGGNIHRSAPYVCQFCGWLHYESRVE